MDTKDNIFQLSSVTEINDMLTDVIRQGAKKILATAIETEVNDFLLKHAGVTDEQGRRQVVRNGHLPERNVQTGIGNIPVKMPRIRNNSDKDIRFHSALLPPYLKRTKSIESLLPWLYLKGISTGEMGSAVKAILGEKAHGLSAKNIGHLTHAWQDEYEQWSKRDLSHLKIVYAWADGVYLNARLDDKQCLLVIIGADETGKKHVLAIESGERESTISWKDVLLDLKNRGLKHHFKLAVGDGAMGFWAALSEVFPDTQHQRCWLHKTMNVLNKLPKSQQTLAKVRLHDIWMASTRKEAENAFDTFVELYDDKYPKATGCLSKDREALLSFYDFPAQHWHHLRTTNPIESTFATIKLRTSKTRGCLSRKTGLAMVYKLAMSAQAKWPRLRGSEFVGEVIRGIIFKDGIKQSEEKLEHAA